MKCILMHGDTRVCLLEMLSPCHVMHALEIYSPEHVPVGCRNSLGNLDVMLLTNWLCRRVIPGERWNIDQVRAELKEDSIEELAVINYMAGLSDSYWLLPFDSHSKYSFTDFHQCSFGNACADVLLSLPKKKFRRKLFTPSFVLNGKTPKAWIMRKGIPELLKAGGQVAFNEILASWVLDIMDVPHVRYHYYDYHGVVCACCECVVNRYEDFVPASDIYDDLHLYQSGWDRVDSYVKFAESNGLDVRPQLDAQIVIDFLMRNIDRNWHNFGLIRDAQSLKYIRAMPIFDTGTALFHREPIDTRVCGYSALSNMRLYDDLAHVREFTGSMRDAVDGFPDIVRELLGPLEMPPGRLDRLVDFAGSNCDAVLNFFK